jgi:hypothetical protein
MGCSCDFFKDPIVSNILDKLSKEAKGIIETCVAKKLEIEAEKKLKITERHTDFETLFKEKKEITESKIKEYNKAEYEIDKKLVMNEVEKTEKLYEVGKVLADEFKQETIKKLTNQLNGTPAAAMKASIQSKIDEISSYSNVKFLNSNFGKPLKKALEKYGVDSVALEKYVKEVAEETAKRREEERKEFNIEKNEFDDDYSEKMLKSLTEKVIEKITSKE